MPRKIKELIKDLKKVGFDLMKNRGKGSHRVYKEEETNVSVSLSGKDGADAKRYQEKDVTYAIQNVIRKRK